MVILREDAPLLVSVNEPRYDRADVRACADHKQDDEEQ